MITTLLSMIIGGGLRALPELLSLFKNKQDNAHELAMLATQIELEKTRAGARMDELNVTNAAALQQLQLSTNAQEVLAMLDAQKEALKGQMQPLGIWWVDALNFLVRPLTTYYFLIFYGIVKAVMLTVAIQQPDPWVAVIQVWSQADMDTLTGIISFWFVGRVIDKKAAK